MPPEDSHHRNQSDREFEQALEEIERSLAALKEQYDLIEQKREQHPQAQPAHSERESLIPALQSIQEQLEALEVYIKFLLFSWSDAKEPFWQTVRFGGLGILIGWLLKSCSG
jgi:hypothetical protein